MCPGTFMIQLLEFLLTTLNDLLFIEESFNEIQRLVGGNSAIIAFLKLGCFLQGAFVSFLCDADFCQ